MAVNDYPDSIGVMWPVYFLEDYEHGNFDSAHVTCMYLGEMQDINFTKEELLVTLTNRYSDMFIWATVADRVMFGENSDVTVLTLANSHIHAIHDEVESLLNAIGIQSASSFTDYKPHVTVDQETWDNPPNGVLLGPLMVWWGNERIAI